VLKPLKHVQDLLAENAELVARLKLADEQSRRLQQETERLKGLKPENQRLSERVMLLEEEVRWFKEQYFGRSSQKSTSEISAEQKLLFNEAEVLAAIEAADAAQAARTTAISAHERKAHSGGREVIPAHLPRKEIVHDLPNEQKHCEHEGVCWAMDRIGQETSERYHYEPPKVWVERQVRPKWCCGRCHQGVHIAPCPAPILPKSNASASLLAYLVASKFVDGLPIYRVCQQLKRQEVDLSPGVAGTWVNAVGEAVLPLINLMHEELLAQPFLQMDETYLQVVRSEKAPASDHYMVVRAAGPPGRRIILFNYEPSRTVAALQNLLIGPQGPYTGKLLTDGLELYDTVAEALKLVHFGCLQHCRTYYHKAAKVTEMPSGKSLARVAIDDYIGKVCAVERHIKELREEREKSGTTLPSETVLKLRQERSAPVMAAFKEWVEKLLPGVPPTSALGRALSYTMNQWSKLVRFLKHPEMPVDNNYLENQIRPFAQGRRVWLFAQTQQGARASANLYSLVSCARVNGLEPYAYLRHLFEELPKATTAEALEVLLPWNAKSAVRAQRADVGVACTV
jgi:transposase